MTAPLLSIENMVVAFRGQAEPSVRDVSLKVYPGEILALVGESGSGKSVTVKSVMRLIDFQGGRVTDGRILLSGTDAAAPVDLAQASEARLRRLRGARMAMIFQDPMTSLNPVMTVGAQLVEAIRQHRRDGDAEALALAMLRKVRLSDPERRISQYPHELSGGMRQRVMIAMALVCEPDLLIADEPTTALDVTVQAEILGLIRSLQKQNGMAVLFITHDMGVVAEIADRVAVMLRGEIVEEGEASQVFDAPRHPYTRKLLDAAPKFREAVPARPVPPTAGTPEAKPILSVHHLTARYPVRSRILRRHIANVHAVEDVSFDLHPRETVAVIGESGCGKSSLAKSLLRLVPVADGRAFLAGRDLLALAGEELRAARSDIQMVFQDPYAALDPRMSVRQILTEPLRIRGLARDARAGDAALRALIARVGLPEGSLDRFPHQFSGGQRQRICIARALVLRPRVLIADEPVSALDVAIQAQILALLKSLQQDEDLAMLFISHDMAVVERVAHRIVVMYRGRIVEEGPTAAVLGNPSHAYTRRLLQAVPVSHPRQRIERAPMGEPTPSPIYPVGSELTIGAWRQIGPDHRIREETD